MDRIWLKVYPKWIPGDINPDSYKSIVDLFEQSVEKYKDNIAYHNMGVDISYRELYKKTQDFASFLQNELKLKKGDRFGIMLPNSIQYVIALFGALRAGITVVNFNPLYTTKEFTHQARDSQINGLIILSNFTSVVEDSLINLNINNIIVTNITDVFSWPKSLLVRLYLKYIKKMDLGHNITGSISFQKSLELGRKNRFIRVEIDPTDLAFLQYTGGTTGVSKGAMLTHRNIIANVEQNYAWISKYLEPGKDVALTALPLYHIYSLMLSCFVLLKSGAKHILVTNAREISSVIDEMSKHELTIIPAVNTLFKALIRHRKFAQLNFGKLKFVLSGGMATDKAVAQSWYKTTGIKITEGYGLTEASPLVAGNFICHQEIFNGSIGVPFPSTEFKLLDEEGNEVKPGEPGEICVKGPQVMKGYWNNPEETANVLSSDGWLKTGDIAKIDEQGRFHIVDRKKDMIVVSGYNVYPNEIEQVISEHPDVQEVAVIGEKSEKTGEVIKAFIVKKLGSNIGRFDLMKFCKDRLTNYKIPRHFVFCDDLPKSNVGKILKKMLRDRQFTISKEVSQTQ